jgi:hypothetical protein
MLVQPHSLLLPRPTVLSRAKCDVPGPLNDGTLGWQKYSLRGRVTAIDVA